MLTRAQGALLSLFILLSAVVPAHILIQAATSDKPAVSTTINSGDVNPDVSFFDERRHCLTDFSFSYADIPADAKESKRAFGPPANISGFNYELPFKPITKAPSPTFVGNELADRLCGVDFGEGGISGDETLYKALMSVDPRSKLHKNPNIQIPTSEWESGVEFLVSDPEGRGLQFDRASVFHDQDGLPGYTLFMKPSTEENDSPVIGATHTRQVNSWYYEIPVIRSDLSEYTVIGRIDCGFQWVFNTRGALPQTLRSQV